MPAAVEVYDCAPTVTFSNLDTWKVQMNSVFTPIAVVASTTSSTDCVIDHSTYSLIISDSNGVSLTPSGTLSIDTTKAIKTVSYKVSVVVGFQTVESETYTIEVYDCGQLVTFPNL